VVKAVHQHELARDIKAQICLGNTYYPTCDRADVLLTAGGLHRFNGWSGTGVDRQRGAIMYSLAHRRKIKDEGVTFVL